jgi:mannose-6-phosphate isomerase-like protein (cupin superfamily)
MFHLHPLTHGPITAVCDGRWTSIVHGWDRERLTLDEEGTHFGVVWRGGAHLKCASGTFRLKAGIYFVVPRVLEIRGGAGMVVTRLGHLGWFQLGGPVEDRGRLRYIDGGTDSLLIPPLTRGDPCLNLLHLPARTTQTTHMHPSSRIGLVIRGRGKCVTPEKAELLSPGVGFVIEADTQHRFRTRDEELLIVAYHPDSDFGPTHEDHPMRNRTVIRPA